MKNKLMFFIAFLCYIANANTVPELNPVDSDCEDSACEYSETVQFLAPFSPDENCENQGIKKSNILLTGQINYNPLYTDSNFDQPINTNLTVGYTNGIHSVTASGGASYTIPIFTSPGTGGMQPDINLHYNSQSKNGLLGMGWNLSGLSVISRTGKNNYHDDKVEPVKWDHTDNYTLDGQRLILFSGSNGNSGSAYRTEVESFFKIVAHGQRGNGPSYFTVETKQGQLMQFGNSYSSHLENKEGTETLFWRVNKITDLATGNYMEYDYDNGGNDSRIKSIKYTGNAPAQLAPYNQIDFKYDLRDEDEYNSKWISGKDLNLRRLLTKIEVKSEGNVIRTYDLNYGRNQYSYLREVIETGLNNDKLNSTRFLYGQLSGANYQRTVPLSNQTSRDYFPADFNGDGYSDLCEVEYDLQEDGPFTFKQYVGYRILINDQSNNYQSSASGLFPQGSLVVGSGDEDGLNQYPPTIGDFNGDGKDEIMVAQVDANKKLIKLLFHTYESPNTVSTYSISPSFMTTNGLAHGVSINLIHNFLQIGDFDGDGSTDVLAILHNNINGPKPYVFFPRLGTDQVPVYNISFDQNALHRIIPIMHDDDQKTDLLIIPKDGADSKIYSFGKVQNSQIYTETIYSNIFPSEWQNLFVGDFNGDGKTDLFNTAVENSSGWQISYSTGQGYLSKDFGHTSDAWLDEFFPFQSKTRIADFNGDGKSDILFVHNTINSNFENIVKREVYYSSGCDNFEAVYNTYQGQFPHYAQVFDDNGDGTADILAYRDDEAYHLIQNFNGYRDIEELKAVQNGFGQTIEFEYSKLTDEDYYSTTESLTYPFNTIGGAGIPIVSKLIVPDGVGGQLTTTYEYNDAVFHRNGKGFLGFKTVSALDETTNMKLVSSSKLNTNYATLLPDKAEQFNNSNTLINKNTSSFNFISLHPGTYWPQPIGNSSSDFLTGEVSSVLKSFDGFGNVTYSKTIKGTGPGQEVYQVTSTYEQNNSWIPSSLKEVTTNSKISNSSLSPEYIRKKKYSYYQDGKLRKIIKDPFHSKSVITTYYYTNLGLVEKIITSAPGLDSRTILHEYDSKGRYLEKTINANGDELKFKYHEGLGVVLQEKDINDFTTHYSYDSFGRLTYMLDKLYNGTTVKRVWDIGSGNSTPTYVGNAIYKTITASAGVPQVEEWFDAFGRTRRTKTEGLNLPSNIITTYDKLGRVKTKTNPYLEGDASNAVINIHNYDIYNRLLNTTNDAGTASLNYLKVGSFFKITTTAQDGISSSKEFNNAGRIVKSVDGGGTLYYSFASNGQNRQVYYNSSAMAVNMEYDEYGRQTKLIDPNAGTTIYEYNAFGEIIYQQNANGHVTEMEYDVLGRLTNEITPDGENIYSYVDEDDGRNKLKTVQGANGIHKKYFYDEYSRVTMVSDIITADNESFSHKYTYDNYGRVNTMKYPSGYSIQNTYDPETGIKTIVRKEGAGKKDKIFDLHAMNAIGQYTSYTLGNHITTNKTYNKFGMLTNVAANNILDLSYKYDLSNGNMNSRQDNNRNLKESFTYDNLNRLVRNKVTNLNYPNLFISQVDLTFTSNGNISSKSDAGDYSYHPEKRNAVSSIDNATSAIPLFQQDISYTHFDKSKSITEGSNELTILYGPGKTRKKLIFETNGVETSKRYYSGTYEKIVTPNGTTEINYILTGGGLNAMVIIENGVEKEYYVYSDHQGSILALANVSGLIEGEQSFDAWGRNRNVNGWNYNNVTSTMPDWFLRGSTGHEHYADFGLINMNGRCYDPLLGRVLSVDNNIQAPGFSQNYNRYSYVLNNPLKYDDPDGEWIHIVVGGIFGGVTNLITNWDNIDNFGEGLISFGAGAAQGALSAVHPALGAIAGNAFKSGINEIIATTNNEVGINDISLDDMKRISGKVVYGAVTGALSYGVGNVIKSTGGANDILDMMGIKNNAVRNIIGSGINGAATGFVTGYYTGLATSLYTGTDVVLQTTLNGTLQGFAGGIISGSVNEGLYQLQLKMGRNKILNSQVNKAASKGSSGFKKLTPTPYVGGTGRQGEDMETIHLPEVLVVAKANTATVFYHDFPGIPDANFQMNLNNSLEEYNTMLHLLSSYRRN